MTNGEKENLPKVVIFGPFVHQEGAWRLLSRESGGLFFRALYNRLSPWKCLKSPFQCPSARGVPENFKTHPTFIPSANFDGVMAV